MEDSVLYRTIAELLQAEEIRCFAALPLSDCRVLRPYLLEHAELPTSGSAVMIAVPYLCPEALDKQCNLSAYAVCRDYHLYFRQLFDTLCETLRARFPQYRFAGFADHSPIDERDAALKAGLGVRGQNGLVLTEKYASFVFLGELITDAPLPGRAQKIKECAGCKKCLAACPVGGQPEHCLSALTQKKGTLTPDEIAALAAHPTVWGCDICQLACPMAQKAIRDRTAFSPIAFFRKDLIYHLDLPTLDTMPDNQFAQRAYAWRTRKTVRRNLLLKEEEPHA